MEQQPYQPQELDPKLPEHIKNYLIDIDGTICEDIPNERAELMKTATVFPDALEMVNQWYDEGHIITFFTSRKEEHRVDTEEWLRIHGFKYHSLLMNKPRGGNYHWIDNCTVRATQYKGAFTPLVKKMKEVEVFQNKEN